MKVQIHVNCKHNRSIPGNLQSDTVAVVPTFGVYKGPWLMHTQISAYFVNVSCWGDSPANWYQVGVRRDEPVQPFLMNCSWQLWHRLTVTAFQVPACTAEQCTLCLLWFSSPSTVFTDFWLKPCQYTLLTGGYECPLASLSATSFPSTPASPGTHNCSWTSPLRTFDYFKVIHRCS